jgi:hypothetical protein
MNGDLAMKRYLFHYRYDGKEFGFDVPADSLDEAKGRVKAMTLAMKASWLQRYRMRLVSGCWSGLSLG